jgi:glycosyltransferase involved in cell wall biosynthesis
MASGITVVATAVGGIPEQIVDYETGFLVPQGNSDAMAQKIFMLMKSPELCRQLGLAAASRVHRLFDLNKQGESYLEWFTHLREEYK